MLRRPLLRTGAHCVPMLALAGLLLLPPHAAAQTATPAAPAAAAPDDNAVCTPGVRPTFGYGGIASSGQPFSATLKITVDKKMSDGTVVHGVTRVLWARDSNGKLRMESSTGCEIDEDGHAHNKLFVSIMDPLEGTYLTWNAGGAVLKIARRTYAPDKTANTMGIVEWTDSERTVTTPGRSAVTTKIVTIGTKKIDGIQALGQKSTTTAVSLNGSNTLPTVTTREHWISVEHGLLLSDVIDDPDKGRTAMVLEDLSLKEPDPSLFVPPDGYTITQVPEKTAAAR
jgi:hypothetical protein